MKKIFTEAKVYEQIYALTVYQCAQKLAESGNKVRLLYWNLKPLIENLGSGTVDVAAAFLGNHEAEQMYGNVLDQDIAETLQNLFRKFVSGDEMHLYQHEIKGIEAIDWEEYSRALVVPKKRLVASPSRIS